MRFYKDYDRYFLLLILAIVPIAAAIGTLIAFAFLTATDPSRVRSILFTVFASFFGSNMAAFFAYALVRNKYRPALLYRKRGFCTP